MCLCARMLALEWKERAFIEKVNSRCFVDFRRPYWCTMTVPQYGVSIHSSIKVREMFRQVTQKLYGGPQRLGQTVYIFVFSFSWFLSLDGFQFIFCAVFIVLLTVKAIYYCLLASLSSRRFEVVGERENGRARGRHTGGSPLSPRVSPSRAPVFSCAHYFQTPATQAIYLQIYESLFKAFLLPQWKRYHVYYDELFNTAKYLDARWRSQTRYNWRQQR